MHVQSIPFSFTASALARRLRAPRPRTSWRWVACLAIAISGPAAAAELVRAADVLIVNARVYAPAAAADLRTAAASPADAVAIRGDRIVAVGRGVAFAGQWRGPTTHVIDAGGRTLLPGIQDGHVHFIGGGLAMARVQLEGARDVPEIQRRVKAWADANPDAPWVQGRGWIYGAFPESLPHRKWLDEIVPDRPVWLRAFDGHTGWANGRALALAGITKDTPDPPDGVIVRDPATGEPTGALKEGAKALVAKLVPEPTRAERLAALRAALAAAARAGVVRMHSLGGEFEVLELLDELQRAGELTARLDVAIEIEEPGLTDAQREAIAAAQRRWSGDRLAFGGAKIFLDGVIDTRTAAMLEPYAGTNDRGKSFWERADYLRTVQELDALGVPVATHAIGDASIRLALDAYEAAARANGAWRGRGTRRHKIEHIEAIGIGDAGRFRRLDVTASFQPLHANPEPGWIGAWAANLGPARIERGFAWGLVQKAGGRIAFGSDFPVVTIEPWPALQMALTRQYVDAQGSAQPPGGWVPAQRLTLDEALAAYTINVARALNRDGDEGSIAPGKLADLVLLDRDLHATPPLELGATKVLYTLVGGKIVYAAGEGER